jgi:2-dehydro-3-deoxy-L-rhamnonate dehydrogenase (NAD+)
MEGSRAERPSVVTGAASGIGRDVARRLSAEGARVSMWDLNVDALGAAAAEASASDSQVVDIAAEDAVDAAMQRSIDALGGRLDILVACAGITGLNGALKDYAGNEWRKVFDVNVNGAFYCNRAAVRAMDRVGYGRIVNVASVAGKEGNPNASAYSASKARHDRHPRQLHHSGRDQDRAVDQMTPQHIEFMLSKIPLGRFGTIEEATSLVCWLASEVLRDNEKCKDQKESVVTSIGRALVSTRKQSPDVIKHRSIV